MRERIALVTGKPQPGCSFTDQVVREIAEMLAGLQFPVCTLANPGLAESFIDAYLRHQNGRGAVAPVLFSNLSTAEYLSKVTQEGWPSMREEGVEYRFELEKPVHAMSAAKWAQIVLIGPGRFVTEAAARKTVSQDKLLVAWGETGLAYYREIATDEIGPEKARKLVQFVDSATELKQLLAYLPDLPPKLRKAA